MTYHEFMIYMTKQEITLKLQEIFNLSSPSQLGDFLGVKRQTIHQWKNGKRQKDITTVIISLLIKELLKKN